MDVFDPADVGALADVNAHAQHAAVDVADRVQLVVVLAEVNPLIGVDQGDVLDSPVHAAAADGERVSLNVIGRLFGVVDGESADRRGGLQVDGRLGVRFSAAAREPECAAERDIGVMRRLPDPGQGDTPRNAQVPTDQVIPDGCVNLTAPGCTSGIERGLEGRGDIGLAVADRAVIGDEELIGWRGDAESAREHDPGTQAVDPMMHSMTPGLGDR